MEEQSSPMEDSTDDPGIDQTDTASGDGAAEPVAGAEEEPEGSDTEMSGDEASDEESFPEAEQEPVPDEEPDGQQATMEGGQDDETEDDDQEDDSEDEQGGNS